jgi:hypothetical protein
MLGVGRVRRGRRDAGSGGKGCTPRRPGRTGSQAKAAEAWTGRKGLERRGKVGTDGLFDEYH